MESYKLETRGKGILMKAKPGYGIYLVTDDACLLGRSLYDCVEQALAAGVTLVQYRSKHTDGNAMYTEAMQMKAVCDKYNVPLVINDRLDVAMAVEAAGVHLGQNDLPCSVARKILGEKYLIGVSAHNPQEALQAVHDGADYLGCGAVFGTITKTDTSKLGIAGLSAIRKAVTVPIVGIGGINIDNYNEILKTGADGAAIVSGILAQDNITNTVTSLKNIYESIKL